MLPPDTTLQRMTDDQLHRLWKSRPQWPDADWVRVAKEVRHREKFSKLRSDCLTRRMR